MTHARSTLAPLFLATGLVLAGCDAPRSADCPPAPAAAEAAAEAQTAEAQTDKPQTDKPAAAAAPAEPVSVAVPSWTNEGEEREVVVLHKDERLKVAAIALRRGTPLPIHEVSAKISIQVLSGSGELSVAGEGHQVSPGSVLIIDPEQPHAMTPAGTELVVLLVHYLL